MDPVVLKYTIKTELAMKESNASSTTTTSQILDKEAKELKAIAKKFKKDATKFKTKDHCKFLYQFLKVYTILKQDTKLEVVFMQQLSPFDKYTLLLLKSLSVVFSDAKYSQEDILALSNAYLEFLFCIQYQRLCYPKTEDIP